MKLITNKQLTKLMDLIIPSTTSSYNYSSTKNVTFIEIKTPFIEVGYYFYNLGIKIDRIIKTWDGNKIIKFVVAREELSLLILKGFDTLNFTNYGKIVISFYNNSNNSNKFKFINSVKGFLRKFARGFNSLYGGSQ